MLPICKVFYLTDKIDVAVEDIGVGELDGHVVANVKMLKALDEFALDGEGGEAHPGPLFGGACDHRFETLADLSREHHRGGRFVEAPLNLRGVIFFLGAVLREGAEVVYGIGKSLAEKMGFDKALQDEIGIAAVGSCRMDIVAQSEIEMARGVLARKA